MKTLMTLVAAIGLGTSGAFAACAGYTTATVDTEFKTASIVKSDTAPAQTEMKAEEPVTSVE